MSTSGTTKGIPIPLNIFKRKSIPFGRISRVTPKPEQLLHPFFRPGNVSSLGLCMKEGKPALLDSKSIIPSIVQNSKTGNPVLANCSLAFSSVQGVSTWLKQYENLRETRTTPFSTIPFSDLNRYLTSLPKSKVEIIEKAYTNLINNDGSHISKGIILELVHELSSDFELAVFSENILIFFLNDKVSKRSELACVLEAAFDLLDTHIDQPKTIYKFLMAFFAKYFEVPVQADTDLNTLMVKLLMKLENKFHLESMYSKMVPELTEALFSFYTREGNLHEANIAINDLIKKGFIPKSEDIENYLTLINTKYPGHNSQDYMWRLFHIAHFEGLIQSSDHPNLLKFLVQNCRHREEIETVFTIVAKNKNSKILLEHLTAPVIDSISNMKMHRVPKSSLLSDYYKLMKDAFNNELSHQLKLLLLQGYIKFGNFSMSAKIIEDNHLNLTVDIANKLIKIIKHNNKLFKGIDCPGFSEEALALFLECYIKPFEDELDQHSKKWLIRQQHYCK
ncbi:ATPase expression protein 1 [Nakaseomyces glabratus]|nr:ATPase expression protein 1 [Nakaseomyces glabratus]